MDIFPVVLIIALCLIAITTMISVIVACCGALFKDADKAVEIAVAIQRWGTVISIITLVVGVFGSILTCLPKI